MACRAATVAGVAGQFQARKRGGMFAVLATDPALAFLSTVSGVTPQTVAQALDLIGDPAWAGVAATVTVSAYHCPEVDESLSSAGLIQCPDRALAVRRLDRLPAPEDVSRVCVVAADDDRRFVDVLVAGYEVSGTVADFIAAEHSHWTVRRFFAVDNGTPVGAAAMTVHGQVAVLGGASTLPTHRGHRLQSRLIEHRVRLAAEAGCTLAVATVRPDSPSASNLNRAGFRIHRHSAWTRPRSSAHEVNEIPG